MRRLILAGCVLLLVGIAIVLSWVSRATPQVRERIVAALNERFDSQVELGMLQLGVFPRPQVSGAALVLRHGEQDRPPLITIEAFHADAGIAGLARTPLRLHEVAIEGLLIRVPPGGLGTETERAHAPHPERPPLLLIDRIESREARLEIASGRPGRLPRIFDIHDLVMRTFGASDGSPFEARLTNPVPRGEIATTGTFGPWHADEPGLTPVRGKYLFERADLGVIRGLAGTLSSSGAYSGILQRIAVDGTTDTPDFALDVAGNPVPLHTTFNAVVDGTSGDTFLERVEARLNDTFILADGEVVRADDVKGRRVDLDVRIEEGRIEDLLPLAMSAADPPLTGRIDLVAAIVIPAGEDAVIDRLELDGAFQLAQAQFTHVDVQQKIATLSQRGRGDEGAVPAGTSVVSSLGGRFTLRNAVLTFADLTFAVPGAVVQLAGTYHLRQETLDLRGHLFTDATLADMTSGVKSLLARLAQPLFRRPGGGSKLPIKVTGSRSEPSFGLDVGGVF